LVQAKVLCEDSGFSARSATMRLQDRAMNVSLHLSAWQGQRVCERTTKEVLSERHVDADGGKFTKFLVPKAELDPVMRAQAAARAMFKHLSLPWGEDGLRIISSVNFFPFHEQMQTCRETCDKSADAFAARYPDLLTHAPARLNGLYDPDDFPAASQIRERFAMRLAISPVPAKEDFRVTLGADIEAEIRENIESTVTERLGAAQRNLWGRVFGTLKHFAATMGDKEQNFKNTTVERLRDLAQLAPKLSLVPDPTLERLCQDISGLLDGVSAEDLRDNQRVRAAAAGTAASTLAEVERAMQGAF
jgi:hypothetical protein